MSVPRSTDLQEALACVRGCLVMARETLGSEAYEWFLVVIAETARKEVARITFGDLLREIREEGGE